MTDFRDFVIRHLRPWHDFVKKCYINDVDFMEGIPETGQTIVDGRVDGSMRFTAPTACIILPEWTKHVTDDARLKFQERAADHLEEAWTRYRGIRPKEIPDLQCCAMDGCGSFMSPGYPLASIEEFMMHLREVHGADDEEIAEWVQDWEARNVLRLPSLPFDTTVAGELLTQRNSRKRGSVETVDNIRIFKRSRR